jgi:hypothetical protein
MVREEYIRLFNDIVLTVEIYIVSCRMQRW